MAMLIGSAGSTPDGDDATRLNEVIAPGSAYPRSMMLPDPISEASSKRSAPIVSRTT